MLLLGKAHEVFQNALHKLSSEADAAAVLAKSGKNGRLTYAKDRAGFRHELASAAVINAHPELAAGVDPDLVTYLVGAHHGRVRLGIRSRSGESADQVLGVRNGDPMPAVDLGHGEHSPECELDVSMGALGGDHAGRPSWTSRAVALLDEHGPFKLAWLETIVRVADWRASKLRAEGR